MFGKIDLEKLSYLIVISEVQSVGNFLNSEVYKVKKLLFLPINGNHPINPAPSDQYFIQMLEKLQNEQSFYFSPTHPLTMNLQHFSLNHHKQSHLPPYSFNHKLLE